MKKRKKQIVNLLKLGVFLFGFSLLLWNCEKEDVIEQSKPFSSVSKNEILNILTSNNTYKSKKINYYSYNIDDLKYDELTNTNEKLAVIPATTSFENLDTKLIFFKRNNDIKSLVFNVHPYKNIETSSNKLFSGEIFLATINGELIRAFRVIEGNIIEYYTKRREQSKKTLLYRTDEEKCREQCGHSKEDPWCICNEQSLDNVIVNGNTSGGGGGTIDVNLLDPTFDLSSSPNEVDTNETDLVGWNYTITPCSGDKVRNTVTGACECPTGKIEDGSGNCMDDPCKKISYQISNANFKAKKEELEKVTGKKQETGYVENKTGTFTPLPVVNGGHSLDLNGISYSNINGFIHTHLNNFETGEIDVKTGNPKINEIYRIFSPADVLAFLAIAKRSTDISNVYATVIASSGDYTLKFTGKQSDIKNLRDAEDYRADYINMMKKGKEKGFLYFLKKYIKIDGIELYKLHKPLFSSTIKVQKKSLTPNGKVDKTECQ